MKMVSNANILPYIRTLSAHSILTRQVQNQFKSNVLKTTHGMKWI